MIVVCDVLCAMCCERAYVMAKVNIASVIVLPGVPFVLKGDGLMHVHGL